MCNRFRLVHVPLPDLCRADTHGHACRFAETLDRAGSAELNERIRCCGRATGHRRRAARELRADRFIARGPGACVAPGAVHEGTPTRADFDVALRHRARTRHDGQPDVLVVPGRLDTSYVTGTRWPRCISPSSFAVHARNDRVAVRRYFSRNDVPEYWIVDCDGRAFERWRPHDERPELYRSD